MTVTHGENKVTTNGLPKKEAEVNPIAYYSVALKATLFLPYRHGLTTTVTVLRTSNSRYF